MPTSEMKALAPGYTSSFPPKIAHPPVCVLMSSIHPVTQAGNLGITYILWVLTLAQPPQRMNHHVLFSLTIHNLSGLNLLLQPTAPRQAPINTLRFLELPPIWFPDSRCYAYLPLIPAATVKIPKTQNLCSILSTFSKKRHWVPV